MNSWLGESCPKSKKILEHPFGLARDLKFRFALALSPRFYGLTMAEGRTLFFSQMFSRFQAYKKETSNFLLYLTRGSNLALTFNSITLLRIPRNKSNFFPRGFGLRGEGGRRNRCRQNIRRSSYFASTGTSNVRRGVQFRVIFVEIHTARPG